MLDKITGDVNNTNNLSEKLNIAKIPELGYCLMPIILLNLNYQIFNHTKNIGNRMKNHLTEDLIKRFDRLVFDSKIDNYHVDLFDLNALKNQFLLSNQFLYITDLKKKSFPYIDKNVSFVLGYDVKELCLHSFYDFIHPDDQVFVLSLLGKLLNLAGSLKIAPMEHTLSMDFRIKQKNGYYKRILRQTSVYKSDKKGHPVLMLNVCTDISHINKPDRVDFSISGNKQPVLEKFLQDEINADSQMLSKRELDIAKYLVQGKSSREISDLLCISKNTVDTHRRNMLEKTNRKNTPELILYCVENGLV